MKKVFFGSIAVLAMVFSGNAQERLTSKDLEFVGIQHNQGLEKVYNFIVENKIDDKSKSKVVDFILEIAKENSRSDEEFELASKLIKNSFSNNYSSDRLYTEDLTEKLSDIDKSYLDKLNDLLNNNYENSDQFTKAVAELENSIDGNKNLNNNDLLVLYTATNTAKYSFQYWERNSEKWTSLNKNESTMKRGGRRIVGADIIGGVAGAAGAWIVNVMPGAGQVAYGSAIVGAAVGNSICEAGSQLMDWLGW